MFTEVFDAQRARPRPLTIIGIPRHPALFLDQQDVDLSGVSREPTCLNYSDDLSINPLDLDGDDPGNADVVTPDGLIVPLDPVVDFDRG
jgi:hypothetical protein